MKTKLTPIELEIFKNRFRSICEEMGVGLCQSAFSTNIKERQDFSCAIFDSQARLIAQAAHIPVHLGSMPLSVQATTQAFQLKPGDAVILNDPYAGGTHLPDITLVTPVFLAQEKRPRFFVANRAHHADVGGVSPGSMPLSDNLNKEGVVISPTLFKKRGRLNQTWLKNFLKQVRSPLERQADLLAQQAANHIGVKRLQELTKEYGKNKTLSAIASYQNYESKMSAKALAKVPAGTYHFSDFLEDDGMGSGPIKISVDIKLRKRARPGQKLITVDFTKSAPQVKGPLNATYAITLSAVVYVFRCLVFSLSGEDLFAMDTIELKTKKGSIVDASYPAPVAGGNVETSQRIVDVLLGALSQALPKLIPAASQGTMNNLALGNQNFSYYETLAGGMGASAQGPGASALQSHMTNTLNTPIEALEHSLPLKITRYQIFKNSGGKGEFKGGNGLIREYEFLETTELSLLSERRKLAPYGLRGGEPGKSGIQHLIHGTKTSTLAAKTQITLKAGERLRIATPGGGGWGTKK